MKNIVSEMIGINRIDPLKQKNIGKTVIKIIQNEAEFKTEKMATVTSSLVGQQQAM